MLECHNRSSIKSLAIIKAEIKHRDDFSGVYKIDYEECDKVYIGETGRKFIKGVNEHENSY